MSAISFENGWYFPNAAKINESDDFSKITFEFDVQNDIRSISEVERVLRADMGSALDRIEFVSERDDMLNQNFFGYVIIDEFKQIPSAHDGCYRIRLALSQPNLHELVSRIYMKLVQTKDEVKTISMNIGGTYMDTTNDVMAMLTQVL